MRRRYALLLLVAACAPVQRAPRMPAPPPLVDLADVAPGILADIRYAGSDNVFGRPVYAAARCWLLPVAAERLARVQASLEARRLKLKVWDCYRPLSVQKQLWELKPDARFVAPPERGSRHNRAAAVDVTLADLGGRELAMPTPYDTFGPAAHRDWLGATAEAKTNRDLLRQAMEAQGFVGLPEEWWHFDDPDWASAPVLDIPLR